LNGQLSGRLSGGQRGKQLRAALPILVALVLLSTAGPASATIGYRVSLANPDGHLFQVTMTVPVEGKQLTVAIPAWNALYQVRDFALRVHGISGVCGSLTSVSLEMRMLDKQTWQASLQGPCQPGDHNVFEIHYSILWNDPGPFDSQFNAHHAFANLGEILMYVPDRRAEDVSLVFSDLPAGWKTAAQLGGSDDNMYVAPSYDALVDAPVEAGKFEEFQFASGGAHFRVVVDANRWDKRFLEEALHTITRYELELMGGPPFETPDRSYTFIFHIGTFSEVGGGGMEHANSTAICGASVETVTPTAAHEFFHVWNVKRIRPQALDPVDYTREQYTRSLWFAEGVTNTYSAFTLERTGLWSKKQFFTDLTSQIDDLQSRPARSWQSAEDASLEAWLEKYDVYDAADRSVSYYGKGQILGVLLDLAIRDATDDHKSLDDVMRRMNADYAQQHKSYPEGDGIRAAVEAVAGKSFEDFFRSYVSGTAEIPYNDFFGAAGLELKQEGSTDAPRYDIVESEHPTERQRRILSGFLRGRTD
jgi:predicted metalloprotease with PDZ domain